MTRKIIYGILTALVVVLAANVFYVSWPAYAEKAEDPRNEAVTMVAHLRWGIDPTTVVVDLWGVSPTASVADVDRSMLDIASGLKNRSFSTAELAYRGTTKFQMEGSYFRQLGEERSWQNPLYTIRTMPSNMRDMSGQPAFETWTGGFLGVTSQQMKDHLQMHRLWYLDAL